MVTYVILVIKLVVVYALSINNLLDPHGVAVQTHHVHTYSYHDNEELDESVTHQPTREVIEVGLCLLRIFVLMVDMSTEF